MTEKPSSLPEGIEQRIDKACDLILECLDMNKITKSEGVSAMASCLVSILAHHESEKHFLTILEMMKMAFAESRKKNELE